MPEIQKLSPHLDQFTDCVRQAKDEQHLTLEILSDQTGLSISTVTKIISGVQRDPKLSVAAALCGALGLSLDRLCGLATPQPADAELSERYHALELENAELRGVDRTRLESIASQRPIILGALVSFVMSILTTVALAAYLVGDAMHVNIGLIKGGELSGPAIAIIILIVIATGNAIQLGFRLYRYRKVKP